MKKLVTLVIIATTIISMHAQDAGSTVVLLNHNAVQKKVEKSDDEIQDPKKNVNEYLKEKAKEIYIELLEDDSKN